ncbi:MAG: hypothetical protein ABL958_03560 [Bdellovibrionia bacterium]
MKRSWFIKGLVVGLIAVAASPAFAVHCLDTLNGKFFRPDANFHQRLSNVTSGLGLLKLLRDSGWYFDQNVDVVRASGQSIDPFTKWGLVTLAYGSRSSQKIRLTIYDPALSKSDVLKLALAIENGASFITNEAIPAYVASRAYTADIDLALNRMFKLLAPDGERIENRNLPPKYLTRINYMGGGMRIQFDLPDPMGKNVVASPEDIIELYNVLKTGSGQVNILD